MTDSRKLLLALALQRASFLRAEERLKLWDIVDDAARLSVLSLRDLEGTLGRRLEGRCWKPMALFEQAELDSALLDKLGARFIQFDEPDYPPLLRETAKPPFGLYARGPMLRPESPAVAIVGTRMPTGRGLETARRLAFEISIAGLTVISGLARGIDAAAHHGALDAAVRRRYPGSVLVSGVGGLASAVGLTCAVLPCGIDSAYPPSNRRLAAAILDAGGLLLSEYPPGTDIQKYRFPERNRIIAGVARACVVVEAPLGSGALITAGEALSEGRDLWVAADCLGGGRSGGIDRLAAEGAPRLASAADLFADWGMALGSPADPVGEVQKGDRQAPLGAVGANEGRRLASSLGAELGLGSDLRERALTI